MPESSGVTNNFSGALITGIAVGVVVALSVLGLTLLIALHWRKLIRRVAPNKLQTPESEKPWPKPPRKSSDSTESTHTSNPSHSRQGSTHSGDRMSFNNEDRESVELTIPSPVLERAA
ncbi:hypothetical protein BJ170DRAFT_692980 [Xylariales sp. AK1849]|nr:hypothetical protein BJ170DRAFT_692980 [Xylariales sp. AK1849]